jgi:putative phage-type endonuclease
MTAVLIAQHEAGTPEWRATRTRGIGGSEIAAVVGLSPYESAFSLWHKKKGNIPSEQTGEHLGWGNRLEPVVADHFASRHQELWVMDAGGTYAHEDRPWQLANPDRLIFPPRDVTVSTPPLALLEVKTSRFGDGFTDTEIPVHYACQVQHYLDVLGLDLAYVAVLIGGNEYREYRITADADDQAVLREAGARFWESLQNDDEPPIDASFATYEAVRELHPQIDGSDMEIDPALFGEYQFLRQAADSYAADLRAAKSRVLAAMGNARRALVNGTPTLRRQPGRGGAITLREIK